MKSTKRKFCLIKIINDTLEMLFVIFQVKLRKNQLSFYSLIEPNKTALCSYKSSERPEVEPSLMQTCFTLASDLASVCPFLNIGTTITTKQGVCRIVGGNTCKAPCTVLAPSMFPAHINLSLCPVTVKLAKINKKIFKAPLLLLKLFLRCS